MTITKVVAIFSTFIVLMHTIASPKPLVDEQVSIELLIKFQHERRKCLEFFEQFQFLQNLTMLKTMPLCKLNKALDSCIAAQTNIRAAWAMNLHDCHAKEEYFAFQARMRDIKKRMKAMGLLEGPNEMLDGMGENGGFEF